MTVQDKLIESAKNMLNSGRKFAYKNPSFGETENGRQCWCCVTVVSYWMYEAMGYTWNIGSSSQKYGYFWSPRYGGTAYDDTLEKFGFKRYKFTEIGKTGLRGGDILMANDHSVLMTSETTLAESIPSAPYLRETDYYNHNWLYVWRHPSSVAKSEKDVENVSNSSLVVYTKISPNRTIPRNHKIDTITIHHMAGNCSVETCGNIFAPTSRQASSNYGIGSDGRIALYCPEADRSWCSSNGTNDHRAITIEVADDTNKAPWHSSQKAMSSLVILCADICRRNGISALNYTGNKNGNMTLHKWFASTSCPGEYLESRMPRIASEVNKLLKSGAKTYSWTEADGSVYLVKGSQGEEVKTLQTNLNKVINAGLLVDGDFGSITEKAVKTFQEKYGLVVDGIYGNVSDAKMKEVLQNSFTEYKVKVTCSVLNIRNGAGTNYKINGTVKQGDVYTIVDKSSNWGKLKSGAGWICLDYTKKV